MVDEDKNLGETAVDRDTEQGFTPGPWRAVGYSPGWWQIEGPEQEQIADVNYSDGADEPTLYPEEANARLIAAAPTLYGALVEILNLLSVRAFTGLPEQTEEERRWNQLPVPISEEQLGRWRAALALVDKPTTESAKRPISDETSQGQAS